MTRQNPVPCGVPFADAARGGGGRLLVVTNIIVAEGAEVLSASAVRGRLRLSSKHEEVVLNIAGPSDLVAPREYIEYASASEEETGVEGVFGEDCDCSRRRFFRCCLLRPLDSGRCFSAASAVKVVGPRHRRGLVALLG